MNPFDLDRWAEIAQTMRRSPMRTALTMFGVGWGMFMLLLMLGFGDGLERGVEKKFSSNATNCVYVWGQNTSVAYKGYRPGRWVQFHNADLEALRTKIDGVQYLAPRDQIAGYRGTAIVVHKDKTGSYQVMGDAPEYQHIEAMRFDVGRWIDPIDMAGNKKVAVIGKGVYNELFPPGSDPIGATIRINGVWFQIIGMIHSPRADDQGDTLDNTIHVPFTTFQRALSHTDEIGWFAMTARPDVSAEAMEKQVKSVLEARLDVAPGDDDAIGSFNAAREFAKTTNLFAGIRVFVWFVGTATLLSGAVGVSNIMLIVVKERTREIGIRRAIGATATSVIAQVMQESVVLTLAAGYAGLVAGVATLQLAAAIVGEDNSVLGNPQVDFRVALRAAAVLVVAGALAGLVPAQRAARVNPVDALRAE